MNSNNSIKMTNRDVLLKKHLDIEKKQFYRANPCALGQIDNDDKNLLRKYTAKECKILNGQLFLDGVCKKNDMNFSSICSKKVSEKPLQCEKLGRKDLVPSTYVENGETKSIVKRLFNKDECKKLGGELVSDKYCLDKVKNIDWSSSCGDVQSNGVIKLKPWGKCIREGKSGEECKEELDKKVKDLHLKYDSKKERLNKKNEHMNYVKCIKNKANHLQCALERTILEEENFRKLNNVPIEKDDKEKIKKLFIKQWKNKKSIIHSQCIKSGKEKRECDVLSNLWGEIVDYSMIDGVKDETIDNYQKKRVNEELLKLKDANIQKIQCNVKNNKLRCAFEKKITELENNKHDKLSKEELKSQLENYIYLQKRDGLEVKTAASHYLSDDCNSKSNKKCKFINDIWNILIDYAMQENISDEQVDTFKRNQLNKFNKREDEFFTCLKTGNNFSCGIEYNKSLNQDKVSFQLSNAEILEDRNKFIIDFVAERVSECKKSKGNDCKYLEAVWDKEFIDIVSKPGLTDTVLNSLEKTKIEKVKKIVGESKIKENFADLYERCMVGVTWTTLLQTIIVLGLLFVVFKDALSKNR